MKIKIYVTDDDPGFRAFLGNVLGKAGHQFCLCKNSNELIDALNLSNLPAIIYLDVYMDGEDGISTIKRLQTVSRPFRLRFVTGGEISSAIAASMIAKANDLNVGRTLYKPFPMKQFLDTVTDDLRLFSQPS